MSRQAGSITRLISPARLGDAEAIEQLWLRYVSRVQNVVRRKVTGLPPGGGDEEDVAQSTFRAFFDAAVNDQAVQLESRDELWRLLVTISRNKATDRVRRELRTRRGGGVRHEANELHQVAGSDSTPSEIVALQDLLDQLLARLDAVGDPKLRTVAVMRLEGASTQEIAAELDCTERTVQRKLHILERLWKSDQ